MRNYVVKPNGQGGFYLCVDKPCLNEMDVLLCPNEEEARCLANAKELLVMVKDLRETLKQFCGTPGACDICGCRNCLIDCADKLIAKAEGSAK